MIVARLVAVALFAVVAMDRAKAQPVVESLEIQTASGAHAFEVEVVRAEADMEKGLMFRRSMPANHGMLFDFQTPQSIMMWMKNTYLSLDMVFIDAKGKVISVARRTTPLSEAIISSEGEALGVLEINAGASEKIGLVPGDSVRASIFPR